MNTLPSLPSLETFRTVLVALGGPDKGGVTVPFIAATTLINLSAFLRWRCYRTLGRFYTFDLSVRQHHKLITTGPYSVVRHPGYSALGLFYPGLLLLHYAPGSWLRSSGLLENRIMRTLVIAWHVAGVASLISLSRRNTTETPITYR